MYWLMRLKDVTSLKVEIDEEIKSQQRVCELKSDIEFCHPDHLILGRTRVSFSSFHEYIFFVLFLTWLCPYPIICGNGMPSSYCNPWHAKHLAGTVYLVGVTGSP